MTDDAPRWHLSGFGDEIDPDPRVQVAVLQALGARHLEVRSAWGTNVADFTPGQAKELRSILDAADHRVSAVASPLGKVDISAAADEVDRLRRVAETAHTLGTRYVRIFSFYRPEGVPAEAIRDDVLSALAALADVARSEDLVLLHENEKEIYGDTPERVLDLARNVASPSLRLAWDAANFVQVGVRPHTAAWADLAPYVEYLQVKDADLATGRTCPAGDGDGEVEATVTALAAAGYSGFASLEPHLTEAGRLGGFSGPAAFGVAARAFARITDRAGVQLR
ncbi:sugar phosphate isomerase/epimerase family protein [Promicromonospora sp. Populi]|uniref:sugar phosphate isomerase/epimerase family protein n=1 Tax=Promicromonospora sp. Populi TaxID=3239420 RepID=UPI0034E2210E